MIVFEINCCRKTELLNTLGDDLGENICRPYAKPEKLILDRPTKRFHVYYCCLISNVPFADAKFLENLNLAGICLDFTCYYSLIIIIYWLKKLVF